MHRHRKSIIFNGLHRTITNLRRLVDMKSLRPHQRTQTLLGTRLARLDKLGRLSNT